MTHDKKIMLSLANWLMLERCKQVDIDPSNTHIVETVSPRGQRNYALVRNGTKEDVIRVGFKVGHAPIFNK